MRNNFKPIEARVKNVLVPPILVCMPSFQLFVDVCLEVTTPMVRLLTPLKVSTMLLSYLASNALGILNMVFPRRALWSPYNKVQDPYTIVG